MYQCNPRIESMDDLTKLGIAIGSKLIQQADYPLTECFTGDVTIQIIGDKLANFSDGYHA